MRGRDIILVAARVGRPPIGESRVDVAEARTKATTLIIELLAGSTAEDVMFPDLPPLPAPHDDDQAAALASTLALNADALVAFAAAEAEAIIRANADVLAALAGKLAEIGTLSGDEVDAVIIEAISTRHVQAERERRADWKQRIEGARQFEEMVESSK